MNIRFQYIITNVEFIQPLIRSAT
uniref:Uncharacterized protein n=1 Tax=Rhizophora mucronata TaxID=61149 RepID=A0A2P2PUM4_RHIMU